MRQAQKQPAEREKIQRRTEANAEQHEKAQLSAPDIERQKQQADEKIQREKQVENGRQRVNAAADEAKNVIDESERRTEQQGGDQLPKLQRNRQLHQPSRRRKKPPSFRGA